MLTRASSVGGHQQRIVGLDEPCRCGASRALCLEPDVDMDCRWVGGPGPCVQSCAEGEVQLARATSNPHHHPAECSEGTYARFVSACTMFGSFMVRSLTAAACRSVKSVAANRGCALAPGLSAAFRGTQHPLGELGWSVTPGCTGMTT